MQDWTQFSPELCLTKFQSRAVKEFVRPEVKSQPWKAKALPSFLFLTWKCIKSKSYNDSII